MANNQINIDLNVDANQSTSSLKNLNVSLSNVKKTANDTTNTIQKTTSSINDFKRAIQSVRNIASGFGVAIASFKSIQKIFKGALENSQELRDELDLLKQNISTITATPYKKIGDTIAEIVRGLNEWATIQNSLSGATVNNIANQYQDLLNKNKAVEDAQKRHIEILKIAKAPIKKIQQAELQLLKIKEKNAQVEYDQSGIFEVERKKQLALIEKQIEAQKQLIANAKADDGSSFMYGVSQADTIKNLEKQLTQLAKQREEIQSAINIAKSIESDAERNLITKTKERVELEAKLTVEVEKVNEVKKEITKETSLYNEELYKTVKNAYEWLGYYHQIRDLGQSIASLTLTNKLIDTSIYDKAISEVKAKITEFNRWKEAMEEEEGDKEDAEFEAYLERLNKEYEIAKEIGDKMTMLAIENKKKELDKQKEALEKEKQITVQEKALEKELAIAEYNKAYAEWQNECMIAEQTKQMNLAEAIIQPLQAAAYAALGIAQSFATGGPIGAAIAAASSIGIISAAVSTASAYKNSAQQLDSVKASPPEPPAFRFGTQGYQLKEGEQAIVGEAGAEIIKNMAGKLVVESNAQAKATGKLNGVGMYVETVIFNVNSIVDKQTIFKAMNEYKERNSFAYTR